MSGAGKSGKESWKKISSLNDYFLLQKLDNVKENLMTMVEI
jgi:hypothetical protein